LILVISDHLLSSITGTQMAAEMKREKPSVPIIILSSVTEIPEGVEHADLFLSKLETPVEVLRQSSGLLKRGKAAAAENDI
jgi:FixJ family two-component response regulator